MILNFMPFIFLKNNFGKTGTRDARLLSFWIGWMKLEESVWRQREGKSRETAKKEM